MVNGDWPIEFYCISTNLYPLFSSNRLYWLRMSFRICLARLCIYVPVALKVEMPPWGSGLIIESFWEVSLLESWSPLWFNFGLDQVRKTINRVLGHSCSGQSRYPHFTIEIYFTLGKQPIANSNVHLMDLQWSLNTQEPSQTFQQSKFAKSHLNDWLKRVIFRIAFPFYFSVWLTKTKVSAAESMRRWWLCTDLS